LQVEGKHGTSLCYPNTCTVLELICIWIHKLVPTASGKYKSKDVSLPQGFTV